MAGVTCAVPDWSARVDKPSAVQGGLDDNLPHSGYRKGAKENSQLLQPSWLCSTAVNTNRCNKRRMVMHSNGSFAKHTINHTMQPFTTVSSISEQPYLHQHPAATGYVQTTY